MTAAAPIALFDSIEFIDDCKFSAHNHPAFAQADFAAALEFLNSYDGNKTTFNAYRREVERLLHWSWMFANKSITELRRADIEEYLQFCQNPPKAWIGVKKPTRFIVKDGARVANPEWRPFVATVSKVAFKQGKRPNVNDYELSQAALAEIFAILSSFYRYLIQEEITEINPIANIRQKSKYLRKKQGKAKIRRLSELQWDYVIRTTENLAAANPDQHERTLFIMTALFTMYLRISELASSERWSPKMNDFFRDHDGLWWFTTVGKGNKERQIAVSDDMLKGLRRWREHLNLTPLPSPADNTPLLPKTRGKGPITNITYIRDIVQNCFDLAAETLTKDGLGDEAKTLLEATVHWLRHTGISEDVKHRPREHVRDDAGHSSSAITDKYIDVELRARHASAKNKPLNPDED